MGHWTAWLAVFVLLGLGIFAIFSVMRKISQIRPPEVPSKHEEQTTHDMETVDKKEQSH